MSLSPWYRTFRTHPVGGPASSRLAQTPWEAARARISSPSIPMHRERKAGRCAVAVQEEHLARGARGGRDAGWLMCVRSSCCTVLRYAVRVSSSRQVFLAFAFPPSPFAHGERPGRAKATGIAVAEHRFSRPLCTLCNVHTHGTRTVHPSAAAIMQSVPSVNRFPALSCVHRPMLPPALPRTSPLWPLAAMTGRFRA